MNLPKGLPASALGLSVYHAFVAYTGTEVHMASSPLALRLVK